MALDDLAARLADAGAELASAASALPGSDPGAAAFGAGGTGRLADLGHDLHRRCLGALETRAREAAAHAARLSATADSVTRAGAAYAAADEAARHRAVDRGPR